MNITTCILSWSVQPWKNIEKRIYHICILYDQMFSFFKNIFHAKYELLYINNSCKINNIIKKWVNSPGWCVHYWYTLAFCVIFSELYFSLCCFLQYENKWIEKLKLVWLNMSLIFICANTLFFSYSLMNTNCC